MSVDNIMNLIKTNRFIRGIYYHGGNLFVKFLRLFAKTDDSLILFVSYGGRRYSDSPVNIYEAMIADERFKNYRFVWAFREPEKHQIPGNAEKIQINSLKYLLTALKARCWVTNVTMGRGLWLEGKHTYYFHTTHGILVKLGGYDSVGTDACIVKEEVPYDCSLAQSEYEAEIETHMFRLEREKIKLFGYPKNDILANCSEERKLQMRKKLGLPLDKKLVMYAPTYRENTNFISVSPVHFEKWREILGDEYVILYRAHPVTRNATDLSQCAEYVIDVTDYPETSDLMVATDILVSDYSGIMFDYAVLNRPIFCWTYDYEDYSKVRGMYFDIRDELPGGSCTEETLVKMIKYFPDEAYEKWKRFRNKYVQYYGDATKQCVDNIYENIKIK